MGYGYEYYGAETDPKTRYYIRHYINYGLSESRLAGIGLVHP